MDGQYPPPMGGMGGFYPTSYPQMMPPEAFQPRLHQIQTLSMESLGKYSDYDDPNQMILPAQGQQRRRRQQPGSEHVKHRRTRSGCYTCRQRRVKCDESHPICDRCRKGKRECNYPGNATSASKSAKNESVTRDSPGASSQSDSEDRADESEPPSAVLEDEELDDVEEEGPEYAISEARRKTVSSTQEVTSTASPSLVSPTIVHQTSSRPQVARTNSKSSVTSSIPAASRWSSLPQDVRFYLAFFKNNLTYHHYAFKYDGSDFLKTTFLEIAMNDTSSALLYGIVAFAAYHHSLTRSDHKISIFLSYYNKSITCLHQSLMSKKHTVATLLTILQLAAIEEYLGDWVNLLGHQRAAYSILTELFTPQTIMRDETRRKLIAWYIRFDIFAGLMSGGDTTLSRDWFAACSSFYQQQTTQRPEDLGARFEAYFATSRLLATDVTLLFAARRKDTIGDEEFFRSMQKLALDFAAFGRTIETAFTKPSDFVTSFLGAPPRSAEDITDFRDPNFLYAGRLATMNFILIDFWGIDLMFKYQASLAQQQQPPTECTALALKTCKLFEAIQYADEGPAGGLLGAQASLGIAAFFLPKDERHTMWLLNKFTRVEQLGYIYPAILRKRMSDLWSVDVSRWWLPNDEGYPTIIRHMREFIEYRDTVPTDVSGVGLRDMSGIFRSLNIEEGEAHTDDGKSLGREFNEYEVGNVPWVTEMAQEQTWS